MEKTQELEQYFALMQVYPELFRQPENGDGLEIITDLKQMQRELEVIEQKMRKTGDNSTQPPIGLLVDDPWYYIIRDLVRFPSGYVGGYIRFINKKSLQGGFNVVMLTWRGEEFFLIHHYRHEERQWSWEFPRGFGEPGLTAEECARKEIDEELHITDVSLVELMRESDGLSGGTAYFMVEIPDDAPLVVDRDEGVDKGIWLRRGTLEDWIREGKIFDPYSLKAYLYTVLREKYEARET